MVTFYREPLLHIARNTLMNSRLDPFLFNEENDFNNIQPRIAMDVFMWVGFADSCLAAVVSESRLLHFYISKLRRCLHSLSFFSLQLNSHPSSTRKHVLNN
jgi:hypothetical protein